jgi:hypothetical protein
LSHCEDQVKHFAKTTGCYCVALYQSFDPLIDIIVPVTPGHNCCFNCKKECTCAECVNGCRNELPFEDIKQNMNESTPVLTRPGCDSDKEVLKAALTELSHGNNGNNAFGEVLEHCFLPELVEDIVNNCHYLFSIQDIIEQSLPVYSIVHCLERDS